MYKYFFICIALESATPSVLFRFPAAISFHMRAVQTLDQEKNNKTQTQTEL